MSYAVRRIERAANQNSVRLNLSRLGLTQIPPQLWQLTKLQVLWLHDNQLSTLPVEVGQLFLVS